MRLLYILETNKNQKIEWEAGSLFCGHRARATELGCLVLILCIVEFNCRGRARASYCSVYPDQKSTQNSFPSSTFMFRSA